MRERETSPPPSARGVREEGRASCLFREGGHARDLGEQVRRALSSVALNIGEGNRSEGGNRLSRFSTAAGSNAEVRAALRVAVAWGYVSGTELDAGEQLLDRVAAMLYRLGARG